LKRGMTMIMQGTTPRTLNWSGLLAVLGLSATLLPLSPSWAQRPGDAETPAVASERPEAGDSGPQAKIDIEIERSAAETPKFATRDQDRSDDAAPKPKVRVFRYSGPKDQLEGAGKAI